MDVKQLPWKKMTKQFDIEGLSIQAYYIQSIF